MAALTTLVVVAPARAQEPPVPCVGRSVLACVPSLSVPVPANGALAIAAEPGEMFTLWVSDETGADIPGALTLIANGMWAWRPETQPAPGRYYVTVVDREGGNDSGQIEIVDAVERSWPELTSAASVSQVTTNEAPACCTLDTGDGMIDFSCTALAETTYALLHPGLSSSSPPLELNQYVFRYTAPDHSSEVFVLPWTTPAQLPIYEMADEYCYEIAAIDLISGLIHPYAELPARCASHGKLGALESKLTGLADRALTSTICPMPPEGLSERWCTINQDACDTDRPPRHCHFYPYTCLNQPYPGPGWRGQSSSSMRDPLEGLGELVDRVNEETGGGDAAVPSGGARDPGAEVPAEDPGGSCAIRRPHTSLGHLLLGYFAAFAWRAYRRRVR